ncbi:MAG: AsnC family transcriptional regulator [Selenomonadaceae bacterium]|nr:AsnC family transcriptional regulator [Selenomonadaceae bacterium]
MTELSTFDRALLNLLQSSIPICSHPFAAMADQLGTDEQTVLNRLRELKSAGCLRRIGTFFDSNRLGYRGVLVALSVEPDAVESVATIINQIPGITHNYEREGNFNLWFTLLSPSSECEQDILDGVAALDGVNDMIRLRSNKKYKVNVQFKL